MVSPILTIQRRMMELGRIRLGDKGPKGEPRKLTQFRLTSASLALLEAAAAEYGGIAQPWVNAPDEGYFELYTEADQLDILLPPVFSAADGEPTTSWSQWFEQWSGGGCQRRCDGVTELLSGKPCLCAAEGHDNGERPCKITTRVNMILPKIPGVGVWRLESHGMYAAVLLPGTLDLLQMAASEGQFIPAVLRIEQRTKKADGQTRKFIVPVIDLPDVKLVELPGVVGPQAINPPTATPPKPELPPAAVEPPKDEKFENDQAPWPESDIDADTTDFQPPEHIALTEKLKGLADELGLAEATAAAIKTNRSKNTSDLPKHITWLKSQVTRAETSLRERGEQETLV